MQLQKPTIDRLELIADLAAELRRAGVRCCIWKGTSTFEQVLQGEKDIDLLIDRAHFTQFLSIAVRLEFRACAARYPVPGVFDFLAVDEATGKLVHLHLHLRIIAGHPLTHNYHLPVERLVLESRIQGRLFDQISSELEYLVFVSRMALYRNRVNARRQEEYQILYSKLNGEIPEETRADVLPMIPTSLWNETCRALREGKLGSWGWRWIRHQWHARLRCETVNSQMHELALRLWRRIERFLKRKIPGSSAGKLQIKGVANYFIVCSESFESARLAAQILHDWLCDYIEVRVNSLQPRQRRSRPAGQHLELIPIASNSDSSGSVTLSQSIHSISVPEAIDALQDASVVKQLKLQLWRNL